MQDEEKLEAYGCQIFTSLRTGLKVFVVNKEVILLHLSPEGIGIGCAHLDQDNARRLYEELGKALDKKAGQPEYLI